MRKKKICDALFDEKDISFDGFIEDLSDGDFIMGGSYDALCYLPTQFGRLPIHVKTKYKSKQCVINACNIEDWVKVAMTLESICARWNIEERDKKFMETYHFYFEWRVKRDSAMKFIITATINEL